MSCTLEGLLMFNGLQKRPLKQRMNFKRLSTAEQETMAFWREFCKCLCSPKRTYLWSTVRFACYTIKRFYDSAITALCSFNVYDVRCGENSTGTSTAKISYILRVKQQQLYNTLQEHFYPRLFLTGLHYNNLCCILLPFQMIEQYNVQQTLYCQEGVKSHLPSA